MKYAARVIVIIIMIIVGDAPLFATPKVIPVINGYFSTGQWYFRGDRSSLGGNAALTVVPALQFSNEFTLIPIITSQYRGTRSLEELAGGNTLFQDTWENAISLKAVHGLGEKWKLKEKIGVSTKWFRETTDENWTNGLYDYRTHTLGVEVERIFSKKASVALGYDFSFLMFPNYTSLEAEQATGLSREFAADNALDNFIHMLSVRASSPFFAGINNSYQIIYSPRFYRDQTIVNLSGLLTPTKRKDDYIGASLSMDRTFRTSLKTNLIPSIYYSYTNVNSNQNHYDARLTTFIGDYYDYTQNSVGINFNFSLMGKSEGPVTFDAGASYSNRDYSDRVTQTVNGAYDTEKLYIQETNVNFAVGYPFSRALRLRVTSNFGRSKSNNDYEAVYRYNYDNANYQFGFTYEY